MYIKSAEREKEETEEKKSEKMLKKRWGHWKIEWQPETDKEYKVQKVVLYSCPSPLLWSYF